MKGKLIVNTTIEMKAAATLIPDLTIGSNDLTLMLGPCSVESYAQTRAVAEVLVRTGVRIMRGGAFKPRTSPDSFQGLGERGLEILRDVADEFGLLVITEALAVKHVPVVAQYADIVQIGSRNMQHYPLLWAVGEQDKPVLLKRGFMSTIDEWLKAAQHIESRGNENIILCERGIRTFETATRNTLDTNAIAYIKQLAPYPIIADPSHATGRANLVFAVARAAVAAGADGLLVEFHPNPAAALSDGEQSLPLSQLPQFVNEVTRIAQAMDRGGRMFG
ncbi:MAG: 3-deoxy-7-phosphoheptulonate synthase [Chloroflexi bacterium]|nr:3-deoxy-7-phosphoheptulonate synthase [Chloroflexota bacterium]